ncbi:MAG TPA: Ig-like domain-containing protein [Gemmatimonadales bacterium]|nr:Ig-like domain-containing protein [Gemmatimonadales bacterium]
MIHAPSTSSRRRLTRWFTAVASLLAVTSCGSDGGGTIPPPPPPPTVASLTIQGLPASLQVGETVQLSVVSRDAGGGQVANPVIQWTSTVKTVATVSSNGRVTGVSAGQTIVRAEGAGHQDEVSVVVIAPTPTVVSLLPATVALAPGGSAQLTSAVLGANGIIPGLTVTYVSSHSDVATVDATGKITALRTGLTTITARHGSLTQVTGVTVSDQVQNVRLARLDIIQVAQTAEADVPIVQGKPSAIRIYPVATLPGATGVTIDVRLARGGASVFTQRITTGAVPTSFAPLLDGRAIYLPLPVGLDLNGAQLSAVIDPDGVLAEADEFDNTFPTSREPPLTLAAETLFPIKVRLIPFAPAGQPLPSVSQSQASELVAFMQEIYPTATVTVTVGGGINTTTADWNSSFGVGQALNQLQAQRTQDGSDAYYYGVTDGSPINGAAGWGQLSGTVSMGWPTAHIVAHEVGHNFGLSHPVGCGNGTPGAPGAVIGLPGYNPMTESEVPSSAVSVMSYCPGYVWIQPTAYRTILLRRRSATSLRAESGGGAVAGQAVVLQGQVTTQGDLVIDAPRTVTAPRGVSPDLGPVRVSLLDAAGVEVLRWHLTPTAVANEATEAVTARGFVGVIPMAPIMASGVRSVAIEMDGHVTVRPLRVGADPT